MNASRRGVAGLSPFDPTSTGGWSRRQATHLLWRAQYGATAEEIDRAADEGLSATIDRLLTTQQEEADFRATADLLRQSAYDRGNIRDLKCWWLYRMLHSANPLAEKMTLFWHNHFATSYAKVRSVGLMAAQNDLLRRYALGSFRQLLHGMMRDVAMLVWLDSNANRRRHANENLARELMELFSLDVDNYTETDITEAARALTGWHVREDRFWFNRRQHDVGTKSVLGKSGKFGADDVVGICLDQPACARFLATKLLKNFVLPRPAQALVDELAERIRAHDYLMAPVLRELFSSQVFFGEQARHALIKSPLDVVLGTHRALGARANLEASARLLADLGQDIFEPPSVKGWEGGRLWINSATLLLRTNFASAFVAGQRYGTMADPARPADSHRRQWPDAAVPYYVELLLARDLPSEVLGKLQRHLRQAQGTTRQRLASTIQLIMVMPEFQLT